MAEDGSNVIPFERPKAKDQDPVAILEQALERVRNGEIVHIGVCYVRPDGAVGHTWSEGAGFGPLLGSMHFMSTCFVTESRVLS